jgi:predicted RNase H-like nuclease
MSHAKKKREGRAERLKVLEGVYGDAVMNGIADCAKQGAQSDDVIDAFVALWSAGRIYQGTAIMLPKERQVDRFGLRMEILA